MSSLIQARIAAHRHGHAVGLPSICCSHAQVLLAAMQVALAHDSPLLIEATSNQVDQFGGYTGMTPRQFRDYVEQLAAQQAFPSDRLVLGGDHLGPNTWQALPAVDAMAHARNLVAAYVQAGFQKIHLDCSMACGGDPPRLPDETVATRSAELARVAEATAQASGLPPPVYVIGTEVPVPGGESSLDGGVSVTRPDAAARTLAVHRHAFAEAGLVSAWQRVVAMVVQPGVDFDHSQVQPYDAAAAADLSAFIDTQPGLVFEAHSTDYQSEAALHALVRDHFAILKVGPAATFALREALFGLAAIENELLPIEQRSHLMDVLERVMLEDPRHWRRHYAGTATEQRLLRRYALSDRCRYYWTTPAVQQAVDTLLANLVRVPIPMTLLSQFLPEQAADVAAGRLAMQPEALIQHKIAGVLARYARACTRNTAVTSGRVHHRVKSAATP
ncbi:D-tagatose-bisphosphate aldolase, class II, non-catalytic subunit [Tahibacter amnicola]|uniref:D-tagatose-bisphosphate aldolase, class II, non-catalytic subunit n=1 Tax=Tahibacter amnicola TaxID=2976241 RepID=A0ABY6BL01_9GAMM|nr:D-tagatose-bisphosphate aldolase, class II, non-catalytic subunit [Tahibacter amnicola]UXI70574.1 D-tagatose-bisphosphate aldolase, class II, non-catalytic subunit [Tahibacter amnicola]